MLVVPFYPSAWFGSTPGLECMYLIPVAIGRDSPHVDEEHREAADIAGFHLQVPRKNWKVCG